MYNIIDTMYTNKDVRNEFLTNYNDDIMVMFEYGFRDMAICHKKNLERFRQEFSLFDQ